MWLLKKTVVAWWAIWWGLALASSPTALDAVTWTYNYTLWAAEGIFSWVKTSISDILNSWGVVHTLAPWALAAGWMYLWNKLKLWDRIWDAINIQNQTLRNVLNFTWAWVWGVLWYAASQTAYLPGIMTAWALYSTYKLWKWWLKLWKWLLRKVWLLKTA